MTHRAIQLYCHLWSTYLGNLLRSQDMPRPCGQRIGGVDVVRPSMQNSTPRIRSSYTVPGLNENTWTDHHQQRMSISTNRWPTWHVRAFRCFRATEQRFAFSVRAMKTYENHPCLKSFWAFANQWLPKPHRPASDSHSAVAAFRASAAKTWNTT